MLHRPVSYYRRPWNLDKSSLRKRGRNAEITKFGACHKEYANCFRLPNDPHGKGDLSCTSHGISEIRFTDAPDFGAEAHNA